MPRLWKSGGRLVTESVGGTRRVVLCDDCPCEGLGDRVLLWDTDIQSGFEPFSLLTWMRHMYRNHYFIGADRPGEWTGNLDDYRLIIWPMAVSDPTWWSEVSDKRWNGRLVMTAENGIDLGSGPVFAPTRTYVNGKTSQHGMTVGLENTGSGCGNFGGTYSAHPLTTGVSTNLRYAGTATVSGGTTVYSCGQSGAPMIQQRKQPDSGIDWVVSGDANWFCDFCWPAPPPSSSYGAMVNNFGFFHNLWSQPIP